jgi:hypothetical protein
MVLYIMKDVVITVRPCKWFSTGRIIGKILNDDGTFLTVQTPYNPEPLTLPKNCVQKIPNAAELGYTPSVWCPCCDCRHPEQSIWLLRGRTLCLRCYHHLKLENEHWERYEKDAESGKWLRTA